MGVACCVDPVSEKEDANLTNMYASQPFPGTPHGTKSGATIGRLGKSCANPIAIDTPRQRCSNTSQRTSVKWEAVKKGVADDKGLDNLDTPATKNSILSTDQLIHPHEKSANHMLDIKAETRPKENGNFGEHYSQDLSSKSIKTAPTPGSKNTITSGKSPLSVKSRKNVVRPARRNPRTLSGSIKPFKTSAKFLRGSYLERGNSEPFKESLDDLQVYDNSPQLDNVSPRHQSSENILIKKPLAISFTPAPPTKNTEHQGGGSNNNLQSFSSLVEDDKHTDDNEHGFNRKRDDKKHDSSDDEDDSPRPSSPALKVKSDKETRKRSSSAMTASPTLIFWWKIISQANIPASYLNQREYLQRISDVIYAQLGRLGIKIDAANLESSEVMEDVYLPCITRSLKHSEKQRIIEALKKRF